MTNIEFTRQAAELATDFCDYYCRFPYVWDEVKDGPLEESDTCMNCPLNKLLELGGSDAD